MNVATLPPRAVPSGTGGFHGAWSRGAVEATAFLPRHPSRDQDWEERLDEVRSREPAVEVWERAAADGARLGADAGSLANARALAVGEAVCVTTGQQPGLFLGPLYTTYKAMTAVALARELAEKTGERVVPVFWLAADDSDFAEVAAAVLPDDELRLARHTLDGAELPAGGMVGDLSEDGTRRALEAVREDFAGRRNGERMLAHLDRALAAARDHGELSAALLHDLFAGTGLVVVDGRWPELRRAAAPLFERYADAREEIGRAVGVAGERLVEAGFAARITEPSTRNALFDIRSGRRLPFEGGDAALAARAREEPETLSPNVMLRPIVQDSLFPNVATVGGPGEISYHAQLAPVYERMGVAMPLLFPRFEATLVPRGVHELAERRGGDCADFVEDFDRAMRETAEAAVPDDLREALGGLGADLTARLRVVRERAEAFDGKIPAAVDEAARRVTDAVEKLRDRIARAARQAEARRDSSVKNYREFLRPRGIPQERVLGSLCLFLESPAHPLACLEDALREHLGAVRDGRPVHWLIPFGGCADEEAGP